ncbi:MAG TPA: ATP-grasp domain-containing protein [Methanobacteriaceae archaeon]|nr:ATP-grasp domain-containing protein [Methanobacteriaceae archaeon]
METLMVVGVNTRAVACSLKKLGCTVYSTDYFGTLDLKECADFSSSILEQNPGVSCGHFLEDFNSQKLNENARSWLGEVDRIICLSGSSPTNFPTEKIYGNLAQYEDKLLIYRSLKDDFRLPLTYIPGSIEEAKQIILNHHDKEFIVKPNRGAGGYGVKMWNDPDHWEEDWLLQEYITGDNISASVLSTGDEAQTVITSSQIVGDEKLGQKEPFGYCGNLTPYTGPAKIEKIAESIVIKLGLVGSNGIDFIHRDGKIYVLEVNPRIQGTFECAEASLGINLAEAHIQACEGNLINIPSPKKFAVKMVVHAKTRSMVDNMKISGVHDLPQKGVIIEEGEPVVTVLKTDKTSEDAYKKAQLAVDKVYESLIPL